MDRIVFLAGKAMVSLAIVVAGTYIHAGLRSMSVHELIAENKKFKK